MLAISVWSFGILIVVCAIIWSLGPKRQTLEGLKKYGYFFQGLEPNYWWWEILVKRGDILVTTMVTYTNVVPDVRVKLFWGVFSQSLKRIALFEFNQKKQAEKKATELSKDGKSPHFVQKVKEVIDE